MNQLVERALAQPLKKLRKQYPVITLTGPRQSGKTTLCRMVFADLPYSNLEEPDVREFAQSDPRGFLARLPGGGIIDEFQRVPELTSYIQGMVDEPGFDGVFVLTGSQNLAVRNTVSQSLAGRTALVCLLPFAFTEVISRWDDPGLDSLLHRGFYPRIYDRELNPTQALSDYVATYLERDLRQFSLIRDLSLFQKFLGLCAGRIGQVLNLESLGNDVGVSQPTAREWISILEASYIAFRLPPFFANISKRLIKSPRLYFYDVGLAANLMGISDPSQLPSHPLRGTLYENMIVVEIMKFFLNRNLRREFFFYRDSNGNEVDLVIPRAQESIPIEIKAAETATRSLFQGLSRFGDAVTNTADPVLVYAGERVGERYGAWLTNLHGLHDHLMGLFGDAAEQP